MRELKLRIWEPNLKNMRVFGEDLQAIYFTKEGSIDHIVLRGKWGAEYCSDYILMHYTGLEDKNGAEYADSDIMEWRQGDYVSQRLEKVVWHEAGWWIADLLIEGDLLMPLTAKQAKLRTIIGNIYENPELSEAK